jgi:hypothetical protein
MNAIMSAGCCAQTFPDELAVHIPASHAVWAIKLSAIIEIVGIVLYVKSAGDVILLLNLAKAPFQLLVFFLEPEDGCLELGELLVKIEVICGICNFENIFEVVDDSHLVYSQAKLAGLF